MEQSCYVLASASMLVHTIPKAHGLNHSDTVMAWYAVKFS